MGREQTSSAPAARIRRFRCDEMLEHLILGDAQPATTTVYFQHDFVREIIGGDKIWWGCRPSRRANFWLRNCRAQIREQSSYFIFAPASHTSHQITSLWFASVDHQTIDELFRESTIKLDSHTMIICQQQSIERQADERRTGARQSLQSVRSSANRNQSRSISVHRKWHRRRARQTNSMNITRETEHEDCRTELHRQESMKRDQDPSKQQQQFEEKDGSNDDIECDQNQHATKRLLYNEMNNNLVNPKGKEEDRDFAVENWSSLKKNENSLLLARLNNYNFDALSSTSCEKSPLLLLQRANCKSSKCCANDDTEAQNIENNYYVINQLVKREQTQKKQQRPRPPPNATATSKILSQQSKFHNTLFKTFIMMIIMIFALCCDCFSHSSSASPTARNARYATATASIHGKSHLCQQL